MEETDIPGGFTYRYKGVNFSKHFVPPSTWSDIESFKARSSDVVLNSYPRSGAHWLRRVVDLILDKQQSSISGMPILEVLLPGSNSSGYTAFQTEPTDERRVISTHLPLSHLPLSFLETDGTKIIYLMRDYFDVVPSLFKLGKEFVPELPKDLSSFVRSPYYRAFYYGTWGNHVRQMWEEQKHRKNILIITYEDLKADFQTVSVKIADFLGCPLSTERLEHVIKESSFTIMKNEFEKAKKVGMGSRCLVDKGEIRQRDQYSDEAIADLRAHIEQSLAGTDIKYLQQLAPMTEGRDGLE